MIANRKIQRKNHATFITGHKLIENRERLMNDVAEALNFAGLKSAGLIQETYDNFIGGKWVKPVDGKYFDNPTPVTGGVLCKIAQSRLLIELPLMQRMLLKPNGLNVYRRESENAEKIVDRLESNLEMMALVETWDNGKPIRETNAADMPLAVEHFRYFAACLRAQEGSLSEIDGSTIAYHFHEPLGVVGQIIPWNFPLLMASMKLAPALAAGNCVVIKPAEPTPVSISVFVNLIADLVPEGVLNIVHGFGPEAGKPLASSSRINKIAFTGETTTGRLIMQYASNNIIPVTLELGGKSPNIFFEDVMNADDEFFDKCLEGFAMFALNQGEVCTCPSRALIQESIYDQFMERAVDRVKKITQGDPLDSGTMVGAQASAEQFEKIMSYLDVGKNEGAKCPIGEIKCNSTVI